MFSQQLIDYTQKQFSKPDLSTRLNTMVKQVNPTDILVQNKDKQLETIPYGRNSYMLCNSVSADMCAPVAPLQDFSFGQLGMHPVPSFPVSSKSCPRLSKIKGDFRGIYQQKISSLTHIQYRRGIVVDNCLKVKGAEDIWALGDATATKYVLELLLYLHHLISR
jgi:NADH:ubiquinone reductase (non-electrogenic)